MKLQIQSIVLCTFLSIASAHSSNAQAEEYPTRPLRMLYGFSPGADIGARLFTEKLAERLGHPIVFENAAGAAGNIAADQLARAEPNGYTLGILTGANIVLRPLLHRAPPHEALEALIPISLTWRFPALLVVGKDAKMKDLRELIARAERAPGELTFGHLGTGSVTHLSGELLKFRADIDIRGVPYRSSSALISDIIAGRIDMAFIPPSTAIPLANQGNILALATTSQKRTPFAPDLPTNAEQGYPGFEVSVWFGVFAPAGTPQQIVDRLGTTSQAIVANSDMDNRLQQLGLEPVGGTQAEFLKTIADERILWKTIIEKSGIAPIE